NVEHLLIIGGPTDVVVEQNIVRAAAAGRGTASTRPPAADTLPRAVPLGGDNMWPPGPGPAAKFEPAPRVAPPPRAPPPAARPPQGGRSPEPGAGRASVRAASAGGGCPSGCAYARAQGACRRPAGGIGRRTVARARGSRTRRATPRAAAATGAAVARTQV